MRSPWRLGVLAAFLVVSLDSPSGLAQDERPVSEIADAHVALAKKLEKVGNRPEARAELLLALVLDPDHAAARARLGYEKDGEAWKGAPAPPGRARAPLKGQLARERDELHRKSAAKLARLAREAKDSGDEAAARRLAGLALDEDPDSNAAREVLGHERRHPLWLSPRQKKLAAAFAEAAKKVPKGEERTGPLDDELAAKLMLGNLVRRETPHAVILATKDAGDVGLEDLARTVEVVRASWRHFVGEGDENFAVEGEEPRPGRPMPAAEGDRRPRWLVVAGSEHATFLERLVADKTRHETAKKLKSWSGWVELPSAKLFGYEGAFGPSHREEWVALTTVKTLLIQAVPKKVHAPGFLVEGLTRFFGGWTTGKAELSYLGGATSTGGADRKATSFDDLRLSVRPVLRESLEGDLRRLVSKSLNELDDTDSALAFAFVEFAFETRRVQLRELLAGLREDETPLAAFERLFGAPEAVERELRTWARAEY